MNRTNILATIAILKRAQNFFIGSYQQRTPYSEGYAYTERELHACGNSACISGHIAVSPEWKAAGGEVGHRGQPVLRLGADQEWVTRWEDIYGDAWGSEEQVGAWWGMSVEDTEAIVLGVNWGEFVERRGLWGMPAAWSELTREQAISLFEQLLEREGGAA